MCGLIMLSALQQNLGHQESKFLTFIYCHPSGWFNQENPFGIKNLFFTRVQAKTGSNKHETQLHNYTIKTPVKDE